MQKSHLNIDCLSVICSYLDINTDTYVLDAFSLHEKEKDTVLNYWKYNSHYKVFEDREKKLWHRNGKNHRDGDLPAVEWKNGDKEWWRNGKLHREGDLPAVVFSNGDKQWHKNGKLHREGDLPAVEWSNGSKEWHKAGKLHRDGDLPAVMFSNGDKQWYRNGILYAQEITPSWV
jgi:antitoxin component YwqK of YwqJK toxin-antitoxin module